MSLRELKSVALVVLVLFVVLPISNVGYAGVITISAIDSGHYSAGGTHQPTNLNYAVGGSGIFRDFFVFDLTNVSGKILNAHLRLSNPYNGVFAVNPPETVAFFDVTTSISVLRTGGVELISIFDDLGTGIMFGIRDYDRLDNGFPDGSVSEVQLNSAALQDLNVTKGGLWAIGGSLLTQDAEDHVFGFTPNDGLGTTRELVLNVDSPIPEPTSLTLLGIGALSLFGYGWRRKKANVKK